MNRRTVLAFAAGPLANAALGFISLPLVAWIFSTEDIGRNNVYQVFISFSLLVFVLGLDQAYVREYHECNSRGRLFRLCYLCSVFALFVFILVSAPFAHELAIFLYGVEEPLLYLVSLSCVFIELTSRFLSLIVRMQERGFAYSAGQVLQKMVFILTLLFYVFLDVKPAYQNLLFSNFVAGLALLFIFVWNSRAQLLDAVSERIDREQLRTLLQFGLPLVAAGVAYWGLRATSTIAIRTFSDFDELGLYAMAMSFAGIATIFQMVFSTVWMPLVYKWVANNENLEKIDAIHSQVLAIACCILSAAGGLSWLVDYVLPAAYTEVKYLLVATMVQPLLYLLSETTVVGMNIKRKTGYAVVISLAALSVNILISIVLTPHFGAAGASVANAIAFFVFFIGRTEASSRVWRPVARKRMYLVLCLYIAFACFTSMYGNRYALEVPIIWTCILLFTVVFFRADLRDAARIVFDRKK